MHAIAERANNHQPMVEPVRELLNRPGWWRLDGVLRQRGAANGAPETRLFQRRSACYPADDLHMAGYPFGAPASCRSRVGVQMRTIIGIIMALVLSSSVLACSGLQPVTGATNRWWVAAGSCSIGPQGGGWTVYCRQAGREPPRPRLVYFSAVPRVIPPTTCTWQKIKTVMLQPVGRGWVYR